MTSVSTQVAHDFIGKADAIAGALSKRFNRTVSPARRTRAATSFCGDHAQDLPKWPTS